MWRGYGQNGNGISLEFDFSNICSDMADYDDCKPLDDSIIDTIPKPCSYLFDIENIASEMYKEIKSEPNLFSHMSVYRKFFVLSPLFKHPAFKDEREWRFTISKPLLSKYVKHRLSECNTIIPYVEVKIPLQCLTKVIVGPCYNRIAIKEYIKCYLLAKTLNNIDVSLSEVPYRNSI